MRGKFYFVVFSLSVLMSVLLLASGKTSISFSFNIFELLGLRNATPVVVPAVGDHIQMIAISEWSNGSLVDVLSTDSVRVVGDIELLAREKTGKYVEVRLEEGHASDGSYNLRGWVRSTDLALLEGGLKRTLVVDDLGLPLKAY